MRKPREATCFCIRRGRIGGKPKSSGILHYYANHVDNSLEFPLQNAILLYEKVPIFVTLGGRFWTQKRPIW